MSGCSPLRSPRLVVGPAVPSLRRSTTPNGQPATQVPHPLQTSCCTTTVPNSVRNSAPVGHTSRQPARVQCLHTSEDMSHRTPLPSVPSTGCPESGQPVLGTSRCSTKATCRQVSAPSAPVLSYDWPVNDRPSTGTSFHSLHATSHALHPMQIEVSVKKPTRGVVEVAIVIAVAVPAGCRTSLP